MCIKIVLIFNHNFVISIKTNVYFRNPFTYSITIMSLIINTNTWNVLHAILSPKALLWCVIYHSGCVSKHTQSSQLESIIDRANYIHPEIGNTERSNQTPSLSERQTATCWGYFWHSNFSIRVGFIFTLNALLNGSFKCLVVTQMQYLFNLWYMYRNKVLMPHLKQKDSELTGGQRVTPKKPHSQNGNNHMTEAHHVWRDPCEYL